MRSVHSIEPATISYRCLSGVRTRLHENGFPENYAQSWSVQDRQSAMEWVNSRKDHRPFLDFTSSMTGWIILPEGRQRHLDSDSFIWIHPETGKVHKRITWLKSYGVFEIQDSGSVHAFLDASTHLYKRVCPSVRNAFFLNEPIMDENGRKWLEKQC